jgi:hypothetical protein
LAPIGLPEETLVTNLPDPPMVNGGFVHSDTQKIDLVSSDTAILPYNAFTH